ncbi:MAG TPA: hypothetical protein VGF79_09460 [Bacteroidia bacterium]
MTKDITIAALALVFAISCKSKQLNKQQKQSYAYEFGDYGGFTGSKTVKIMNKDGAVYHLLPSISGTDSVFLGQMPDSLRSDLDLLTIKALKHERINETGNMNAYLKIYRNDSLIREYDWPMGKKDLPVEISNLYDLINRVKK